jgi:tRNA threonylcarbamoyladenosine biosynthesis protein TsaB
MLVLALDTTTRAGSIAVARDGRLLHLHEGDPSRPHAERLPGDLIASLALAGVGLPGIDVFAVAIGPGSFTGLRIGIAAIQGCAFATGRPVVGVSALEAVARAAAAAHGLAAGSRLGVWMDAQRQEVFSALYDLAEGEDRTTLQPVEEPAVGTPDETAARWHRLLDGAWCPVTGDGAVKYAAVLARAVGAPVVTLEPPPLAPAIALIAGRKASRGGGTPPHAIRPLYIRRPDAELARDRQRERP